MANVRELIEAGQPPRENERALVVVDEAAEAELELSFYDYQQSRFIGPQGLTSEPHFFRATLSVLGGKRGYLVGPEVTRSLRHHALVGLASRAGSLGDVPSDVRTYRLVEHGATIDIPGPKPLDVNKRPESSGAGGRNADGDESGRDAVGPGGGNGGVGPQPPDVTAGPGRKAERRHRLAFAAGLLLILPIVAAPFALARLGWYGLVVGVKGSLDFTQIPRQSALEPVVFTPESISVEIRRAFWTRPFEGWWISEKPPAQIEFDSDGWWLSKHDQSSDGAVRAVLRPNAPALSTAAGVLRSQLTFRNTDTGQVFDNREATLRLASPPGQLRFKNGEAIVFTGFNGGPFNPESAQISLSASGGDVRWSAQDIPSWIALSGGSTGKLNEDSSVTLTVAPQAENLAPGPYEGRLAFRNDDEANIVAQKPVRLVVLDAALECDQRAGSRFDPDRPSAAPFVADTSTLSDDDLDQATRACAAAFQGDSSAASRRFIAEMGRAYATRAVRLARSRADTSARATMSDAVRLWQEAAAKGSAAAMNFLGYYWAGLYDDEVDPPPSNKCRSEPPRFSFTAADMRMVRDHWDRAAKASPPNAEAMFNYGRLLVTAPDLCPPRPDLQNISEGISWLRQAVDRGNVGAAEVLGELFYRGRVPSSGAPNDRFPKNVDEGLRWLAIACRQGSVRAKDFVARAMTTREMDPGKRPPGC
jgi:hypothetical protein